MIERIEDQRQPNAGGRKALCKIAWSYLESFALIKVSFSKLNVVRSPSIRNIYRRMIDLKRQNLPRCLPRAYEIEIARAENIRIKRNSVIIPASPTSKAFSNTIHHGSLKTWMKT